MPMVFAVGASAVPGGCMGLGREWTYTYVIYVYIERQREKEREILFFFIQFCFLDVISIIARMILQNIFANIVRL